MRARKSGWNPGVITSAKKAIARAAFDANLSELSGILYRFYGGQTQSGNHDLEFGTKCILSEREKR